MSRVRGKRRDASSIIVLSYFDTVDGSSNNGFSLSFCFFFFFFLCFLLFVNIFNIYDY